MFCIWWPGFSNSQKKNKTSWACDLVEIKVIRCEKVWKNPSSDLEFVYRKVHPQNLHNSPPPQ